MAKPVASSVTAATSSTYPIRITVSVPRLQGHAPLTDTQKGVITNRLIGDQMGEYFRNKGWTWVDAAETVNIVESVITQ